MAMVGADGCPPGLATRAVGGGRAVGLAGQSPRCAGRSLLDPGRGAGHAGRTAVRPYDRWMALIDSKNSMSPVAVAARPSRCYTHIAPNEALIVYWAGARPVECFSLQPRCPRRHRRRHAHGGWGLPRGRRGVLQRDYELTFILSTTLDEDTSAATVERVNQLVAAGGGAVT